MLLNLCTLDHSIHSCTVFGQKVRKTLRGLNSLKRVVVLHSIRFIKNDTIRSALTITYCIPAIALQVPCNNDSFLFVLDL